MSGASALAAAKRRRAVPTEPTRPSQKLQERDRDPPRIQPTQNPTQPVQAPAQNPLQLLLHHEQKLNDLEKSFSQIKISEPKSNVLTPETLQYFKTQHELMNQEINELKKILIKVQTFSMETNLELLKVKKAMKACEKEDASETNEIIVSNDLNMTTENVI
jgi:hypothetical protein